jgi:hypothetical protein
MLAKYGSGTERIGKLRKKPVFYKKFLDIQQERPYNSVVDAIIIWPLSILDLAGYLGGREI